MKRKSKLERTFETRWRQLSGPPLESEVRFHPTRRWRLDFAHLETKIGIEMEGGTWTQGRHTQGKGYANDCEKYNAAQLLGWRVFRLTSDMIREKPYQCLMPIIQAIREESNGQTG